MILTFNAVVPPAFSNFIVEVPVVSLNNPTEFLPVTSIFPSDVPDVSSPPVTFTVPSLNIPTFLPSAPVSLISPLFSPVELEVIYIPILPAPAISILPTMSFALAVSFLVLLL